MALSVVQAPCAKTLSGYLRLGMAAKSSEAALLPMMRDAPPPSKSFKEITERCRVLSGIIESTRTEGRRLSLARFDLESNRAAVSANPAEENEGDGIEALRVTLAKIEKDLLANTEAVGKNLEVEKEAQDGATNLRQQFEQPMRRASERPLALQQPTQEQGAAGILRSVGITKLSPKCGKTQDLARRTTDDTWIQLMFLGCTAQARYFVEQQGWDDCEGIVEAAATRHFPTGKKHARFLLKHVLVRRWAQGTSPPSSCSTSWRA